MNNDYLRVNSKDAQDGVVEGIYTVKTDKKAEQDKTPTLYTFFRKKSLGTLDFHGRIPSLVKPLAVFLISLALFAALALIAISAHSPDIFLLLAVVVSLTAPLFFITAFFEFNTFKNVGCAEIFGGIAIGALYYTVPAILKGYLSDAMFQSSKISDLLFTVISDSGLIVLSYFYVRLMRKANLFASFLLVVCVFGGFTFTNSLLKIYSSLFTSVTIAGEEQSVVFAIIKSDKFFGDALNSFISSVFKVGVYEATLYFSWSVISAGVIALKVSPLKSVYNDGSMYFLLILEVVLHVIENIGSVLIAVDVVLKIVTVSVSIIVALRMLNFIIMKNPRKV